MNKGRGDGVLAALEQVRDELEAWRAAPGKRQKIPEPVWRKAARAARKHGVNPVSKALGLDYNCLKRRAAGDGGSEPRSSGVAPAFIEVTPDAPEAELGCVIELEKGSGTRLRIGVKSASAVDWGRIKEAFLGA